MTPFIVMFCHTHAAALPLRYQQPEPQRCVPRRLLHAHVHDIILLHTDTGESFEGIHGAAVM